MKRGLPGESAVMSWLIMGMYAKKYKEATLL
jgi:hypothetical protein